MIRSLHNLWDVSPGFNPNGVLVFYTALSPQLSSSPQKTREAFRELDYRLSAAPGVEATSIEVGGLPFFGNTTIGFSSESDAKDSKGTMRMANLYSVGRNHFKAMGIPLLRGRSFTDQDTEKGELVTVIDKDSVRVLFPGQDAIGKYLHTNLLERSVKIVGIARRVKHSVLAPDAAAI
jgi:hypothetical protein